MMPATSARIHGSTPRRAGTDEVAPNDQAAYLRDSRQYDPLWQQLSPKAKELVLKGNYERPFDAARRKVRTWETADAR